MLPTLYRQHRVISVMSTILSVKLYLIRCTCTSIYHPYLQSNSDASNFVWLNIWHRFRSMQTRLSWRFDRQKHTLMFYVCQQKLKEKCTIVTQCVPFLGKCRTISFIINEFVDANEIEVLKTERTETNNTQTHKKVFKFEQKLWPGKLPKTNHTNTTTKKRNILYLTIYCINRVITLHQTAQSVTTYCDWLFVFACVYMRMSVRGAPCFNNRLFQRK